MTEDEELLRNPGEEVRLEVIHSAAADGAVLGGPPQHAVIGARPFCSPEYSPDFYKLGSSIPYSEKRRLLDKQKEMEEVKQLDEWRPTVSIFTTLLDGLNDKAN
ncbi:hypothetical protein D9C73_010178 [Collichthys lucidus]|uniref:Uncharacterized protein n=1 Tax=Collichthys lucidus TaxID=240159 RepID=A0A4U5UMS4_COLLU|nr:hypothetical protein D9C73_010178 [Collichthys lucidus]